jgi:hypothetical protein
LRCRLITPAYLDVLKALLWGFHRDSDGRCFPSYEAIAKAADRHRDTVYEALKVLEGCGILSWVHRLKRVRVLVDGLFGPQAVLRPQRTSNAYRLLDPLEREAPKTYKSENPTGPQNQLLQRGKAEHAAARKSCKAADRPRLRPTSPAPIPAEPQSASLERENIRRHHPFRGRRSVSRRVSRRRSVDSSSSRRRRSPMTLSLSVSCARNRVTSRCNASLP